MTADPNADTERFVKLLGAHEQEIFGYVYALTADWNDSQEIMQRVRIRIWQQFAEYDASRSFGAWAMAIAYYLVLAFRKERSRQKEYLSEGIMELVSDTYDNSVEASNERCQALLQCMKRLRADQRRLVDEYYSRNGPAAAIAASIGMQPGALRQAIFRIRRILHKCVEKALKTT